MSHVAFRIVSTIDPLPSSLTFEQQLADHQALLQSYLDTHITRNHSGSTLAAEQRFLVGWFEGYIVPDITHPQGERHLFVWEAMQPIYGRQRIIAFTKGMIDSGLSPRTITGYLGILRRLFTYLVQYPYIPGEPPTLVYHSFCNFQWLPPFPV